MIKKGFLAFCSALFVFAFSARSSFAFMGPQVVNFGAHPTQVQVGQPVTFVCEATVPAYSYYDEIVNYWWDFGDGNWMITATGTITHAYEQEGTYIASCMAGDLFGIWSAPAYVTVTVVSQAQCDPDHLELCEDQESCENAGGYWYDDACHAEPQANPLCQSQLALSNGFHFLGQQLPPYVSVSSGRLSFCLNYGKEVEYVIIFATDDYSQVWWLDANCNFGSAYTSFTAFPASCQDVQLPAATGWLIWFADDGMNYDMKQVRIESAPQPQCDAEHLNLCTDQESCENAGGYWYDDTCNAEPQPVGPSTEINGIEVTCDTVCSDVFSGISNIQYLIQCETWQENSCGE